MSEGPQSIGVSTALVNRAAALLRNDAMPARVGPYQVLELLGSGGMGEVYKARQGEPVNRVVALKLIKLGMDSREVVRRFDAERQTLALMTHANVARIYDAGLSETGRPYFVMEYVEGRRPITDYCDERQLTVRQRLELFIQACDALQHAHTKTVIHRDLKPANVLVTEDETGRALVKVIDFGVAKALGQAERLDVTLTQPGQLVGTPQYMSPEQAELGAARVDTRSDVYSLGMILYELLTGQLPFDTSTWATGTSYDEIRRVIRETDAPRPSTRLSSLGASAPDVARRRQTHVRALRDDLRRELDWIPLRALRKDPAQRYRTAAELADDIRNYLSNRPLIAGPESNAYRLKKFLRRNRAGVFVSAAMAALLITGFVTTSAMYLRAERQRRRAEDNHLRAESESAKQAAVNRFLLDMLGSANPRRRTAADQAKGPDVSVREIVRKAAGGVDAGSLKDQPAVEAAVRYTLGHTFKALGDYDAAAMHLTRAADLARSIYGPRSAESASATHVLAMVCYDRGQLERAESLCREAMKVRTELFGESHAEVAESANDLANILTAEGKYKEAEPLQRRALEMQQRLGGELRVTYARALINLAYLLQQQGKLAEAEPLIRRGLEIHRTVSGAEHPDVSGALTNLASLLYAQGRFAEAEPLYRQALAMDRKLQGNEHPDVAVDLNNLATALIGQGRLAEGESLLRESLAMRRKLFGNDHPLVGGTMHNLAYVLEAQGKLADAEPMMRESLALTRRQLGNDHPDVAVVQLNLSSLLRSAGKLPEAEQAARDAIDVQSRALPPDHWQQAHARAMLADVLVAQRRYGEAETLLLGAFKSMTENRGAPAVRRRETALRLSKLYDAWGKPDEAARWSARAAPAATATAPAR
jgi:serine/threonine protein kinase/Tfp pilus assembly protein PilF